MKTLAEVIKAVEVCNDNHIECDKCIYSEMHYIRGERLHCVESGLFPDALFYLKEYRWVQENCADALAEKYPSENVPLTWDELKQMEGKPVWVEVAVLDDNGNHYKWRGDGWYIVKDFTQGYYGRYCHLEPSWRTWTESTYGDLWQAYRKERR